MTTKAEFNAEEWDRVVEGPAIAGMIVITAQKGGTIRESMAMAKTYAEAAKEHGKSELMSELTSSAPRLDAREFESKEQLASQGLERIRGAVALLESKATPEELESYRQFTLTVAERAAEATKSGDVMGVGGERVSDDERQAMKEIAGALGAER
jgi:hypothetical protein